MECKYLRFHANHSVERHGLSLFAVRCSLFIAKPIALYPRHTANLVRAWRASECRNTASYPTPLGLP